MTNLETVKAALAKQEAKNGNADDAVIVGEAYHACSPDADYTWTAPAIRDNGNGTYDLGWIDWDFAEFIDENGGEDVDDAGSYPWGNDEGFRSECEGCTAEDDKEEMINWMDSHN